MTSSCLPPWHSRTDSDNSRPGCPKASFIGLPRYSESYTRNHTHWCSLVTLDKHLPNRVPKHLDLHFLLGLLSLTLSLPIVASSTAMGWLLHLAMVLSSHLGSVFSFITRGQLIESEGMDQRLMCQRLRGLRISAWRKNRGLKHSLGSRTLSHILVCHFNSRVLNPCN